MISFDSNGVGFFGSSLRIEFNLNYSKELNSKETFSEEVLLKI